MSNESLLKTGLIVTVFFGVVFYHASNFIVPSDPNLFAIFKLSQFAVITVFVSFAVWTQIVPRLIPWEVFIGGKYSGRSSDFQLNEDSETIAAPHDETFAIKQTVFETTIEGVSKLPGETDNYSTWLGHRFYVHGNTHYFGLIITTPGSIGSGVLQLTIIDGDVTGFYFSGDPSSTKRCRLSAKHISPSRNK